LKALFAVQKGNHETMKGMTLPHQPQDKFRSDFPLVYSIRVIGLLDKSWSKRISGLTILSYNATLTDGIEMTTLTGELVDQAALIGVLNALYNLRLTIWSVKCLGTPVDQF